MDTGQYIYSLHVAQQPQRARMCGFGDKDRRPITPPPCIRLSIIDKATNAEVDVSMLDVSFYILTVDLWDELARNELNLVVHPSSSIAVINSTAAAPTPVLDQTLNDTTHKPALDSTMPWPNSKAPWVPYHKNAVADQQQASESDVIPNTTAQLFHLSASTSYTQPPSYPGSTFQQREQQPQPQSQQQQHTPGSFTRNLIGSLVASAFKLNDMNDDLGIWFILQDLSVRTEGTFRLKFNFVNLSIGSQLLLTSGSAPVLCSGFSNPFSVYSAKRFPGMIESTDISRKFSNQGIKIPVRKAEG